MSDLEKIEFSLKKLDEAYIKLVRSDSTEEIKIFYHNKIIEIKMMNFIE